MAMSSPLTTTGKTPSRVSFKPLASPPQRYGIGYPGHLPNGNYTAIVSGKNNTTGVSLLEVYKVAVAASQ